MQIEPVNGRLKTRKQTDGKADAARGVQDVEAATHAADGTREIRRALHQEVLPRVAAQGGACQFEQRLAGEWFTDDSQCASDADGCGQAGFEMQVARALPMRGDDQGFERHGLITFQLDTEGKTKLQILRGGNDAMKFRWCNHRDFVIFKS